MELNDILIGTIADTLGVSRDQITPESRLVDLAKDSIALFELLVSFEKILGHHVKYDEIAHIETVGDIIAYVHTLPIASRGA